MRVTYDREVDAIYVRLSEQSCDHTIPLDDRRLVDYGADGSVVGVELLDVHDGVDLAGVPEPAVIARLLRERAITVSDGRGEEPVD